MFLIIRLYLSQPYVLIITGLKEKVNPFLLIFLKKFIFF